MPSSNPRKRDSKGKFATSTGQTITAKGYVRLTVGNYRNWYEHRAITSQSIQFFCPEFLKPLLNPNTGLPDGFHVHHGDWNRQHNCPDNLQLLQDVIHNALTLDRIHKQQIANAKSLMSLLIGQEDPMPGTTELPDWVLDSTVYSDEPCTEGYA